MNRPEPLVAVTDLVVADGDERHILDGVSLEIARGETVCLYGPSGAGKSTLALALSGWLRPGLAVVSGGVRVEGRDPFGPDGTDVRARVVSHLGQDPAAALNPARRLGAQLAEAVTLRATSPAAGPADTEAAVGGLLEAVGLSTERAFRRRYPAEVSGGQTRRVALAMALAGAPELLVLDEPTGGLDTVTAAEIRTLLAATAALTGCAMLVSTHDTAIGETVTARSLTLHEGRVASPAPPPFPVRSAPDGPAPTAPGAQARVAVRGIGAGYGRRRVLEGVELDIPAGSCVAIVGPSGSGKSTLARCVVGLHAPDVGHVELDGEILPAHVRRRRGAARRRVQYVPQDPVGALNPRERVDRTLLRALRRAGVPSSTSHGPDMVEAALVEMDLAPELSRRRPGELSGGQRQRVAIARALAAGPGVLVCDEITSALDVTTGAAVLGRVLERCRHRGVAVLLVSHDLVEVAGNADHVVVLEQGRVVEKGPTTEVLAAPAAEVTRRLIRAASTRFEVEPG